MRSLKSLVRGSPFFPLARNAFGWTWAAGHRFGIGKVPPPHAYKQHLVKRLAKRYRLRTLVETGTYMGHMLDAVKGNFDAIYSIELDEDLFTSARSRFAGSPRIEILHGDSGVLLAQVLEGLRQPALFWLDAHYSGSGTASGEEDSPILKELLPILSAAQHDHVILIDDAREFVGADGYPTLPKLQEVVSERRPDLSMVTDADVIRITPTSR